MSGDISQGSGPMTDEEMDELMLRFDRLAEELGALLDVEPPKNWVPAKTRSRGGAVLNTETSRSPETQKRAFEQKQKDLAPRITTLDTVLTQKKLGDPLPDDLKDPVNKYSKAKTDASAAESRGDYMAANVELGRVDEAATALEVYLPHIQAFDNVRTLMTTIDAELVRKGYTTHPAKEHYKPRFDFYDSVKRDAAVMLAGAPDTDKAKAMTQRLEGARGRFPQAEKGLEKLVETLDTKLAEVKKAAAATESKQKLFDDLPQWPAYLQAKQEAIDKVAAYKVDFLAAKHNPAMKACEDFHKVRESFAGAVAAKLMTSLEGKKPKEIPALMSEYGDACPPNLLVEFGKLPKGGEVLDKVVKSIGSKAKTDGEKKLVAAAIQGRFGPKIEGDFADKNLPLLYDVLGKVPAPHVKKYLNEIKSHKFEDEYVGGDYSGKVIRIGKGQTGDDFKSTTLHEVGHAVDDGHKIMANGGPAEYGHWKKETAESVADAIFTQFSRELSSPGMWSPPGQTGAIRLATPAAKDVKDYFVAVLKGNDTAALAGDDGTLKTLLDRHKTVSICKAVRLKNKLWDHGDAGAKDNKLGDRVYQQSYASEWWSYEFAQRKTSCLRAYTFRAPAEWFADAYDYFYRGKLKKAHPLYKWLDDNKKAGGVTPQPTNA